MYKSHIKRLEELTLSYFWITVGLTAAKAEYYPWLCLAIIVGTIVRFIPERYYIKTD